jgi:hypothetical protein
MAKQPLSWIDRSIEAQRGKEERRAIERVTAPDKLVNGGEGQKIALNQSKNGLPFKTSLDEVGDFLEDTQKYFNRDLVGQANLANRLKQTLTITHVPTGFSVAFPAFIDTFNDAFTSAWTQESVYGRMDPIATFNGTERVLSLGWHVPAPGYKDAEKNLGDVNQLISYLYPMYDGDAAASGATSLNQSPLIRIKFGNLVVSSLSGDGLLGYCQGITFDPAIQYGMFNEKTATGPRYFPKTFRLNLELKVLHDHRLGFRVSDNADTVTDPTEQDLSDADNIVYTNRSRTRYSSTYSFNDSKLSWNNFPYHARGDYGASANRELSRGERLIVKKSTQKVGVNPVYQRMFNAEKLGTANIWNALAMNQINQEEANILLRGSNIIAGAETTPGGEIVDYRNTGMNPNNYYGD